MHPFEFFTILTDSKTSLFSKLKHSINAFHAEGGKYSTSGDLVPLCKYLYTFDDWALLKLARLIEEQIGGVEESSDYFVTMRVKGVEYDSFGVIINKVL
jgi:hypothetical protein